MPGLYSTGLRWKDLDLTRGKLVVRQGKGAKNRTPLEGMPISNRYVQQMVKRYVAKAEINKDVPPRFRSRKLSAVH